ncbi:MAG: GDSL-type esterase/lipase family protein [Pleurocapsa sp. MO_192.B19]|nr:GDSL-type esterase/lipase family protein [Pleurocapsa sp. MO_192.B19]
MLELLGIIPEAIIYHQVLASTEISVLANSHHVGLKEQKITADNAYFNYSGRIDWQNSSIPAFSYPGTAVEFKFTGTSLKIELSEDNWGGENYVDVYLDDNPNPTTIKLRQEDGQPIVYDIAAGLENKVHNAVLIKRNDYITGEFRFGGILIDGELLPAEPDSERKIEVYGDSITAAMAVEYEVTGVRDPQRNNNDLSNAYYSYASILARDYDAELSLVAQSGASLIDGFGYWNNGTGVEAFYDKLKPLDNAPSWDFSNYNPDLVIIALGQNDSSTINLDQDLSSEVWKDRYKQFIVNLRAKYPDSYFVGMFPNMYHDRQWDTYLTEAIAEYRQEYNDNRVFSLIQEQVTPGHPRISEQQVMADTLKEFVDGTLTENGFNWDVAD